MANDPKQYDQIIRHLTGQQTPDEQRAFEEWLQNASQEDKKLVESLSTTWNKTALQSADYEPDTNDGWRQLQFKIQMRRPEKRPFAWTKLAAVFILVCVSIAYFTQNPDPTPTQIIKTAGQEVALISLPDGSQVWLSPNASLTYDQNFSENHREVQLSGKAFFEVTKMDGKRFTVLTSTTKTEVLGTSFNLNAEKEDQVQIQVTTGQVSFSDIDVKEKVLLTPGKQATYTSAATKKITEEPIQNQNYRAWQNKKLHFNNADVMGMFSTLASYYDTDIKVSEHLTNCRFTASFDNQTLEEALEILKITGDLTVTKTTTGYHITGNPCN